MRSIVPLVFAVLVLMGCHGYPTMVTCADELPEADPSISCDDAAGAHDALVSEMKSCSSAADCGVTVRSAGCGCQNSTVVATDTDDMLCEHDAAFLQRQESCEASLTTCVCDPFMGMACVEGRCSLL
jgi:hypothetical protein